MVRIRQEAPRNVYQPGPKLLAIALHFYSMSKYQLVISAVLVGLGVAFLPSLFPATAAPSFDPSSFLDSGRLWVATGVILLGGMLTSLTPCVYPLIPITVGVFGARQAKSRAAAFGLTSAYVVGMGLVFSALGLFAAYSGRVFGSTLGSGWVSVVLAVVLAVLAASMFGAFELTLPSSVTTRLSTVGGNGVAGALLMGGVAGLLAAPCTGPVLAGLLAWVAKSGHPLVGASLLFVYALGIGVPFFAIGVFTARLPKGGRWMEWVKSFFGVALLVLAFLTLKSAFEPLRDSVDRLGEFLGQRGVLLVAGILGGAGVLLGAIHFSFGVARQRIWKALGVAAIVVATVVRASAPVPNTTGVAWDLVYRPTEPMSQLESVLAKAKAECRPVMIDFFAEWCVSCTELDKFTYAVPTVAVASQRFVNIKVDGTEEDPNLERLYKQFGIEGLPTISFVGPDGIALAKPRVNGFLEAEPFLAELAKVPACAKL